MNELKLKPCPFCGNKIKLIVCDDEGNIHYETGYENNPWSGIGYKLCHEIDDDPNQDCPIAGYKGQGEMGIYIYDTREDAIEAWNKRVTEEEKQKMNHEQTITWHERDTHGRFKELPEYGESILIATFEGVSYDEYHDFGSDGEYLIISGRNITDILAWAYMPEYKPGTLISESIERNKSKCYAHFTRVRESDGIVEITKCKNCLYYQDNNGGYPSEGCKWNKDETPDPDDYCSCGERMP